MRKAVSLCGNSAMQRLRQCTWICAPWRMAATNFMRPVLRVCSVRTSWCSTDVPDGHGTTATFARPSQGGTITRKHAEEHRPVVDRLERVAERARRLGFAAQAFGCNGG